MARTTLKIQGMSCDHCKRAVEGALNELDGVEKAEVNLQANTASVTYNDKAVKLEDMKKAVEAEGYEVAS